MSAGSVGSVLIVGAGSSGCVLANRLSTDPDRRVVLLEAGPSEAPCGALAAVRNGNQPAVVAGLNWKFRTAIKGDGRAVERGSAFDYEAGRLVGGSSCVNATQMLRGAPADYDEWARACGDEWSWEQVLPVFRALEDDPLGPSGLHGRGGPMPIRRDDAAALTTMHATFRQACMEAGHAWTADLNDPSTTGVGMIPKNVVDGVRISAAAAYLDPVRGRANLHVITGVHVHRLLWGAGGRCIGVEADVAGAVHRYHADAVVLCAGVMSTPAILMRSGVGDPLALAEHGIDTVLPLSGVGAGLMEHPVIGVWGVPQPQVCRSGEPLRQTLLRTDSVDGVQTGDMHLCMMSGVDARSMFPQFAKADAAHVVAGMTVCFNKSWSRGHVRLGGAHPHTPPRIHNNCLGDERDIPAMRDGVRLAWSLLQRPCLQSRFDRFLAWTDGIVRSDVALGQAVRSFVRPSAHPCGSARMGRSPDAGAVVNPKGKLYGATNVWVADTSVFPRLPSAPPHLTCLMVAEKIAHGML